MSRQFSAHSLMVGGQVWSNQPLAAVLMLPCHVPVSTNISSSERFVHELNGRAAKVEWCAVCMCAAGERRWVVTDIVGVEDGLGVENLSGSAAIGTLYCK